MTAAPKHTPELIDKPAWEVLRDTFDRDPVERMYSDVDWQNLVELVRRLCVADQHETRIADPNNDAESDAESERIRRQEHADFDNSRGVS